METGARAQRHDKLSRILANEMDMYFRRRAPILLDYLDVRDTDRVLECGCGRGFFLNMLRETSNADITGLELDEPVVEMARRNLEGRNVHLFRGDACALPYPDASLDKILFTEVLEHIPDERGALAEIRRVLRPGGVVALSVPNARYPFIWDPLNWVLETVFNSPIRKGFLAGIWANHVRLYKEEDLRAVLAGAGFEVEETRPVTYFCFPFAHNLVYGIGKELFEAGLLPKSIRTASDRFGYERNSGSILNPVNLMRKVFLLFDRLNDHYERPHASVGIVAKIRKPS